MFWWFMFYVVACGLWFYAIFPKTTGQRKRRAAANGAAFALAPAIVLTFASAAHPARSFGLLLIAIANVAFSCVIWRDIAAGEGINLRAWSAVCGTGLVLALYYPVIYCLDCFVRGIGGKRLVSVLEGWIVMVALIVLLTIIWSTFCRQRRYSRGAVAVRWIAIALAAIMTISSVVSAAVAVPQSKSVKAAGIPSVFATDGEAFEGLKEFFGRIFGNSKEAALAVTDDESVAAEVADDESVVAEVAEESRAETEIETQKAEAGEEREPIVVKNAWFDFYNGSIQEDGLGENDFNFGPDPGELNDYELDREFRLRLSHDPALGAASMAWVDAKTGMRTMGVFYDECSHNWAKAINVAKEKFIRDHSLYRRYLDNFFALLDSAKVSVTKVDGIVDQFYMNPFTIDGIPDVIVMLTKDHKGSILVYTFSIKDNQIPVGFRKDCGFQGCSWDKTETVAKVTKIQPVSEPERRDDTPKPPTAGKITPVPKAPTPTPVPPTPVPGEGSDPAKDPSKAPKENTERNDDPGPGETTNSGKGSTKSAAASESQKASDGGSVEDYDRKVEQSRSANAGGGSSGGSSGSEGSGQRAGGESNQPSQSVSGKQDNNGNTGNGGSSIDEHTAKSETAASADTNQSVDASGSAGGIIEIPD